MVANQSQFMLQATVQAIDFIVHVLAAYAVTHTGLAGVFLFTGENLTRCKMLGQGQKHSPDD